MRADRSQPDDSAGVGGFLAPAGNLPDGYAWASDVCDCPAFQEHRRLRLGEDGCLGIDQRHYDPGPMGLCSRHDVEFPALSAAPRGSGAGLGGGYGAGRLACGDCDARVGLAPVKTKLEGGCVWDRKFSPRSDSLTILMIAVFSLHARATR